MSCSPLKDALEPLRRRADLIFYEAKVPDGLEAELLEPLSGKRLALLLPPGYPATAVRAELKISPEGIQLRAAVLQVWQEQISELADSAARAQRCCLEDLADFLVNVQDVQPEAANSTGATVMIAPAEAPKHSTAVWLKCLPDEVARRHRMMPEQSQLFIGRHPACEIQVDNACVSSHHAILRRDASRPDALEVEVLGNNGMLVAGRWRSRGEHVVVQSGDRLALCCFQKTQDRQQPSLLAWELSVELECASVLEDKHDHEAWLLPLCARSAVQGLSPHGPDLRIGPPPNFAIITNDSSDVTAIIAAADGEFVLHQKGDAGCFVNEFWVCPGKAEILCHGDVITFCRTHQKFLPNTRGCYIFGCDRKQKDAELPTPCRATGHGKWSPSRASAAGPDSLTMTVQETVLGPPPSLLPRFTCQTSAPDPSQTLPMPGAWWTAAAAQAASREAEEQEVTKRLRCQVDESTRPQLRRRLNPLANDG
mmetsp:Transcript_73790/g.130348  ORF Transcript_73790/g.130348 Transcript_73790/m.130348 type:complete len:481 (-) Transcript_73790:89-1531(-)|eukprot:CAMPEP_0197661394 /NCGR_PEP_ID=MMETSP1338-20131121/51429_1 /TAXON_ID=43686 ORGANISM="Pelagodinium beii, Strain RCC1491" /NCGR_SAMPLE_ID=MMETSP1338 /ASSEMBLY_ACC=CAM_ASM_000754 /LENGTH=480 /DNA_ID=CAMNT_0043238941 /DNA_START=68 /DNA_END=1510 /DNA_ORIENTATION=-